MENSNDSQAHWWSIASIRISHPELDPDRISENLGATPDIAKNPGESKVHYGDINSEEHCASAGYWVLDYRIDSPDRPDSVFTYCEHFVREREQQIGALLAQKYDIDIYIAVFVNVLILGFNLPEIPTIRKLNIPIGIEYFGQ